jgi:hypothetical protein
MSLDEILHQHIELGDGCHRPRLSVWADEDADVGLTVVLAIGPLVGEQRRFVEFTPAEARKLAALLRDTAAAVDEIAGAGT